MDESHRKNILVITLSNIGDVVLTTPVIAFLRNKFPDARMSVVTGPKAVSLLEGSRQIDRLLVYDKFAGWQHKVNLAGELRKENYEWVVDLKNSALPFLVHAKQRSPVFRSFQFRSARAQYLEILQKMNLFDEPDFATYLSDFNFYSKSDESSLSEKLRAKGGYPDSSWIIVAPGAGSEAKRWPIESFCGVIDKILETSSFQIAAVGDTSEKLLGVKLAEMDSKRILNLTGEITLRELAAFIARAKLVLSNDSACMHLGYELDRPVAAIFGPTDHRRYGRESKIWRIVREPSIGAVSQEKVFEACSQLLNSISQI